MGKLGLTTCAVLLICAAAPAADKVFVDVTVGWAGFYRPMEWTPVDVTITSELKDPIDATLSLDVQQDQLTNMTISQPVTLQKKMKLYVPLAAKIATEANQVDIAVNSRWRTVARRTCQFNDYSSGARQVEALNPQDMLIGVSGSRRFGIMQASRAAQSRHDRAIRGDGGGRANQIGAAQVAYKQPELLPWDWPGYASADLLVLYDVDWDANAVRPEQARAIAEWVGKGGRLLLIVGSHPLPPAGPIADLLPLKLGKLQQTRLDKARLDTWGVRPRTREDKINDVVTCWTIEEIADKRWATARTLDLPAVPGVQTVPMTVFAHGPVGFGRVGVIPFDPATIGGAQDVNLARFWIEHAQPLKGDRELITSTGRSPATPSGYGPYGYDGTENLTLADAGANAVMEHLFSIPELRPLSIWVVIVVLLALAVVIGPLDYLALKWVDRLPMTWITSAGWVALFTVGAWYGVQKLRSGAAQMKMVSVVDAVADAEGKPAHAWGTTYLGIFAPVSDQYELIEGSGAPLAGPQWWSSVNPTRLTNMYDSMETEQATRRIGCQQVGGGNIPVSLPINIWTMQCLIRESLPADAPLAARVWVNGPSVALSVANGGDTPITDGVVRFGGNRVLRFGTVAPGQTLDVRGRLAQVGPWEDCMGNVDELLAEHDYDGYGGGSRRAFTGEQAYFARGSLDRTRAMEAALAQGAAVVCARYQRAEPACRLGRAGGQYEHIRLARLLVTPEKGSKDD